MTDKLQPPRLFADEVAWLAMTVVIGESYRCAKCGTLIQGTSVHYENNAYHEACVPVVFHGPQFPPRISRAALVGALFQDAYDPPKKFYTIDDFIAALWACGVEVGG